MNGASCIERLLNCHPLKLLHELMHFIHLMSTSHERIQFLADLSNKNITFKTKRQKPILYRTSTWDGYTRSTL